MTYSKEKSTRYVSQIQYIAPQIHEQGFSVLYGNATMTVPLKFLEDEKSNEAQERIVNLSSLFSRRSATKILKLSTTRTTLSAKKPTLWGHTRYTNHVRDLAGIHESIKENPPLTPCQKATQPTWEMAPNQSCPSMSSRKNKQSMHTRAPRTWKPSKIGTGWPKKSKYTRSCLFIPCSNI